MGGNIRKKGSNKERKKKKRGEKEKMRED